MDELKAQYGFNAKGSSTAHSLTHSVDAHSSQILSRLDFSNIRSHAVEDMKQLDIRLKKKYSNMDNQVSSVLAQVKFLKYWITTVT